MDTVELTSLASTSPSLAEITRSCMLRAGLSRAKGISAHVLGNPKAWLGTAYHAVLEAASKASNTTRESDIEQLWAGAIQNLYDQVSAHPLNRRFGAPETWPGYHVTLAILSHLTEGLNVEVKNWIDPAQPAGAAKIVKGALALRNRNGGYMLIGFDDTTLQPDLNNRPADIRAPFHLDKIQPLISRYAYDPFEIGLAFPERDGAAYPVIVVPEGVRTPVAAKGDIIEPATGRKLIRHGEIYFRTLSANGTPSTAPNLLDVASRGEADGGY